MKTGAAIAVLLFVLGVSVNLTFGRRGFFPLDQSNVFDGGWRILSGQMPFRDFSAPSGIVQSFMQAPLFRLFGVTWFAYCLHASIVNGVFAAAVYALLRLCGSTTLEATLFAALSAFFFYPPTGTPFTDQHSFFFMLLMFVATAGGAATAGRTEFAFWFAVPILFVLGYLSGQIPISFGAVAVAVFVASQPVRARRWIPALAAGTLCAAAGVAVVGWTARIDWSEAVRSTILSPWQVAGDRTFRGGTLGPVRMIGSSLIRNPLRLDLWSLDIALVAAIPLVIWNLSLRRVSVQTWMLVTSALVTAAFLAYTRTLLPAGVGLVMIVVGTAVAAMRQTLPRHVAWPAIAIVGVLAIRDTAVFVRNVDSARLAHVAYDPQQAARAEGHLPPALAFMRWSRGASSYDPDELTALVDFLRDSDGNFVLIGESAILYGLAGKPSVTPVLWLDPGLTVPRLGTDDFRAFDADLMKRIRRLDVRRVVVERPVGWTKLTFDDFPQLVAATRGGACGENRFGVARVLELCADSFHETALQEHVHGVDAVNPANLLAFVRTPR